MLAKHASNPSRARTAVKLFQVAFQGQSLQWYVIRRPLPQAQAHAPVVVQPAVICMQGAQLWQPCCLDRACRHAVWTGQARCSAMATMLLDRACKVLSYGKHAVWTGQALCSAIATMLFGQGMHYAQLWQPCCLDRACRHAVWTGHASASLIDLPFKSAAASLARTARCTVGRAYGYLLLEPPP